MHKSSQRDIIQAERFIIRPTIGQADTQGYKTLITIS